MPELPEVETVVRDLRPLLVGPHDPRRAARSKQKLRRPWKPAWNAVVDRARGRRRSAAAGSGSVDLDTRSAAEPSASRVLRRPPRHDRAVHRRAARRAGTGPPAPRLRTRQRHANCGSATRAVRVGRVLRRSRPRSKRHDERGPRPGAVRPRRRLLPRRASAARRATSRRSCWTRRVVAGVGNIYADEALLPRASCTRPARARS